MLDQGQFRELVVCPTLKALDMYSPAAENLVIGTAMQESRLRYLHQIGGGPALGLFQMEPATHDDIWENWLRYRAGIGLALLRWIDCDSTPPADRMVWDLRYATAMCRIHYRRDPNPLPDADDVRGLAETWKRHYNTPLGAGTVEEFESNYLAID